MIDYFSQSTKFFFFFHISSAFIEYSHESTAFNLYAFHSCIFEGTKFHSQYDFSYYSFLIYMKFDHIYYLHLFKANIAHVIGEPKTVSTPGKEEERRGTIHGVVDLWVTTASAAPDPPVTPNPSSVRHSETTSTTQTAEAARRRRRRRAGARNGEGDVEGDGAGSDGGCGGDLSRGELRSWAATYRMGSCGAG
jgi:hypothetical protein